MKRISYIFMAVAMLLALSCQKDEFQEDAVPDGAGHLKTLTVGVADEPDTRVGFDETTLSIGTGETGSESSRRPASRRWLLASSITSSLPECLPAISRKRWETM